jgi:hypothetical protein
MLAGRLVYLELTASGEQAAVIEVQARQYVMSGERVVPGGQKLSPG